MRFLLIGRQRDTGEVRVVSSDTYATRQDALDRLGDAVATQGGLPDHDLFVVDLDVAVPVVFYPAPAQQAEPQDEPIADVWEAPAPIADAFSEINVVEQAVLEGTPPAWDVAEAVEPLVAELEAAADEMTPLPVAEPMSAVEMEREPDPRIEPEPEPEPAPAAAFTPGTVEETPDLGEALRRAASRMEAEGIVAPANVEAASYEEVPAEEPQAWPWETQPEHETPAVETVETEVPVAPVEPIAFEPVGIDEPGLEEITLLTPVSSDSFSVRPVVVGEYTQPDSEDEESPFAALEAALLGESAETSTVPAEPDAPIELDVDDIIAADPADSDLAVEVKVYEPGGVEIASYTCSDCVYITTCPKANQEGPATCGSFQWVSV
jgi:hypothetical protein